LEVQKDISRLSGVAKLGGQGFFDWTGGVISGSFEMLEQLRVRIMGPDLKSLARHSQEDLSQRGSLLLKGSTTWTGTGEVRLATAAQIVNTGTLTALSDAALTSTSCCVTRNDFINEGTIEKRGTTGTTRFAGVIFDQKGRLNVRSGEVLFETGHVMIRSDARFTGEGRSRFDNNVQVFLAGNATVSEEATVELSGSTTLVADGAFSGDGSVVWTGGYVEGDLEIGEGTTLRMAGNALKELRIGGGTEARILARGDAILDNATLTLRGNSTFVNRGMFRMTGGSHVRSATCCTNPSAFENEGALILPVGADAAVSNMHLRNSGTISLYESKLAIEGSLGFQQSDGQLLLDDARFESQSGFIFAGGKVTGSGALKGSVINYARFAPGDNHGILVVEGTYDQAPSGVLEIEIGGRDAGSTHDRLRVTGRTSLDGMLAVYRMADFVPAENEAFLILPYTTRQGDFARVTGLAFAPERSFELAYDAQHGELSGLVLNAVAPTGRGALFVSGGASAHSPGGHVFDLDPNRLTVEAWIKHSEMSEPDAVIITKGAAGANPSFELSLVGMGEDVRVRFQVATTEYSVVSSIGAAAGVWTHVAGVYDGSRIHVYVDGEPAGSMAYSGGVPPTDAPLRIGADAEGSRGFGGLIDEVRIWKKELSAAALNRAMYRTVDANETGLIAYYPFSAGTADAAGGRTWLRNWAPRWSTTASSPFPRGCTRNSAIGRRSSSRGRFEARIPMRRCSSTARPAWRGSAHSWHASSEAPDPSRMQAWIPTFTTSTKSLRWMGSRAATSVLRNPACRHRVWPGRPSCSADTVTWPS
jgi:hypothetical protein